MNGLLISVRAREDKQKLKYPFTCIKIASEETFPPLKLSY